MSLENKVTKDTIIGEIIRGYKNGAELLMKEDLGCIGCPSAQVESLEGACMVHDLNLEDLLMRLNENLEEY